MFLLLILFPLKFLLFISQALGKFLKMEQMCVFRNRKKPFFLLKHMIHVLYHATLG